MTRPWTRAFDEIHLCLVSEREVVNRCSRKIFIDSLKVTNYFRILCLLRGEVVSPVSWLVLSVVLPTLYTHILDMHQRTYIQSCVRWSDDWSVPHMFDDLHLALFSTQPDSRPPWPREGGLDSSPKHSVSNVENTITASGIKTSL